MWQAVSLRRSRWPRLLLLLWFGCQLLVSWYWPTDWPAYLSIAAMLLLALSAYQVYLWLRQPIGTLWLHNGGLGRWQGETIRWLPQSSWCWAGFWLHWLDSQGNHRQAWWFADAFCEADKRRLARQLVEAVKQNPTLQRPSA